MLAALTFALALALAPGAPQAPTVWTVTDTLGLQAAVQQAVDGATILLEPGQYFADVAIDAKGLTLVGTGPDVQLHGPLSVSGLAQDQSVLLKNFTQIDALVPLGVQFEDNAGAIRVEDFRYLGGPTASGAPERIEIRDCAAVSFSNCVLEGDNGFGLFPPSVDPPGPALEIADADVWLFGCDVQGGSANQAEAVMPGQPAVLTSGACALTVVDSTMAAGSSTSATLSGVCATLDGAPAVRIAGGTLLLTRGDSTLLGQPGSGGPGGGPSCAAPCPPGAAGGSVGGDLAGFTEVALALATPSLSSPAVLPSGAPVGLAVQTEPGELVFVAASRTFGLPAGSAPGLWIGAPLITLVPLGAADAGGSAATTLPGPSLPLGVGTVTFNLQAASIDPTSGQLALGDPDSLTFVE